MASRPEPAQPLNTQLLTAYRNIVHCLFQPQGSQAATNFLCFFGVLYAYIYEYEYIVRMCMNVVVFLIRSEKYARYYYDLSSALIVLFLLYFSLHL